MSDPRRLEFTKNAFCDMGCDCGLMPDPVECKDGRFVFWDDYARLKAEVERLRNLGIKLDGYVDLLQGENERLRKAGDRMAAALNGEYNYELPCVEDWNAAKDGKTAE